MTDYFLLLKLIMALKQDAIDGTSTGLDFIGKLTDAETEMLRAQVAAVSKEAARLLVWREWKEANRQPELTELPKVNQK